MLAACCSVVAACCVGTAAARRTHHDALPAGTCVRLLAILGGMGSDLPACKPCGGRPLALRCSRLTCGLGGAEQALRPCVRLQM